LDRRLRLLAEEARGFMPPAEGLALYRSALVGSRVGPIVELGTYCGKSAVYLGAAARETGSVVFTIDHHRGSEEMQAGWDHHDESLVDSATGLMDSLPEFRGLVDRAGLGDVVIGILGDTVTVGRFWGAGVGMVFIDGGHGAEPAHRDYETWAPRVLAGGVLAIHDVFPDPADGGRPPHEIYLRALDSGMFEETAAEGSLRILTRSARG